MSVYTHTTFISEIEISVAVSLVLKFGLLSAARKINLKQLLPCKLFQLCKKYLNKQKCGKNIWYFFNRTKGKHSSNRIPSGPIENNTMGCLLIKKSDFQIFPNFLAYVCMKNGIWK